MAPLVVALFGETIGGEEVSRYLLRSTAFLAQNQFFPTRFFLLLLNSPAARQGRPVREVRTVRNFPPEWLPEAHHSTELRYQS